MKRRCAPSWRLWSQWDAEFSGGHQGVSVYGAVRHAPLLRRIVHAGRAGDRVQPLCRPPAGVLEPAQRPGEDLVLGPGRVGDLVQAPGGGDVPVSLCRDGAEGDCGLGVGGTAGGNRFEPGEASQALQPARAGASARSTPRGNARALLKTSYPLTSPGADAYSRPDLAAWGSSLQIPPPRRPERAGNAFADAAGNPQTAG